MSDRLVRVALLSAWVALCGFGRVPAAGPIVIGWQPDGAPADTAKGVQMGVQETRQTASLLNRIVRTETQPRHPFVTIRADASDVTIVANPRCTFRMLPTPDARSAQLTKWKQSSGRSGEFTLAAWDSSLERFGAGDVNKRYTTAFHTPMTERAWAGWAAVKAAVEAALRSDSPDGCAAMSNIRFDAHKGAMLSFADGVLQQPLYVIERSPSGSHVVAELPPS